MSAAERVLDALGPGYRSEAGPLLVDLVAAYTGPLEDVDGLTALSPRGWSGAFDLQASSQPEWLARVTGARPILPAGLTPDQRQELVRVSQRWRRGTAAAMKAAVAVVLTGRSFVQLLERNGSPWRLTIRTFETETPTPALVAAVAELHRPVGVRIDTEVFPGSSYNHIAAVHGSYETVSTDFSAYDGEREPSAPDTIADHKPEPGTTP